MGVMVRERTVDEIETKLKGMNTDLNKIIYLESALREAGFSYEIKRFLWGELAKLYDRRLMFEKSARAYANKAVMDVTQRDKADSYINAAEIYAKMGKVDSADEMFIRAAREVGDEQKTKIKMARKNIFLVNARSLETKGKRVNAVKFYEKLIKMNLEEKEKSEIKSNLIKAYKGLGQFREAKLLEGI